LTGTLYGIRHEQRGNNPMWRMILLTSLLVVLALPVSAQQRDVPANAEELTLLGNPKERMQKINRLLREAGERVLEQKRMLDDAVARIIANERKMAASSLSGEERQKLRTANIAAFREIEIIRERIARIQFDTAQEVYQIEQTAYHSMINDIAQKNAQIGTDPLAYWLAVRRMLLSPSELSSNLSENDLKAIYR